MKTKNLILSRTTLFFGGLFAALIACSPLQTRADTIALSLTDSGAHAGPGNNQTIGWAFTLSDPVLVTQLGFWDLNNDGLATSHVVTIWTSTGTQEAEGTVSSGTGGILTNGVREQLSPLLEISRLLVRFNHIASPVINANRSPALTSGS
ncbi:MAG TPA: hypothetical protein VNY07_04145 [Chthoniobacterales bacterium]|jgi:hypothetical protein|nr:hypothetical protein [Chthoniobacterales bacterium]